MPATSKYDVENAENVAPASHISESDVVQEKSAIGRYDDALGFTLDHGEITWTAEEERAVVRKIDMRMIPLMLGASLLLYSDTQAYGIAAIFNMITDLKLYTLSVSPTGKPVLDLGKYQLSTVMGAIGSLVTLYPLLVIAQKVPLGKFAAFLVTYAGTLSLLFIVAKDFSGIAALRFFYGANVVITPLFIILSAMWWRTSEQPLRIGLWITGTSLGSIVGQSIDFGAVNIGGAYTSDPWKWIYVILGSVSIGIGLFMLWAFPDSPMKATFLTEREKQIAVQRVQTNNTGMQARVFKWNQVVEALTDPQTFIICIFGFSFSFANAALGSFGGILVTGFGYSSKKALQLTMPASGVAIFSMMFSGILGIKFHRYRIPIAMLFILPTIAGMALLWKSPRDNKEALLAGLSISTFFYGAYVQQLSLMSSNIAGHTKKTTVNALVFIVANAGSIAGPYAYKSSEQSRGYPTGQITVLAMMCGDEVLLALLYLWYRYRNNKAAAKIAADPTLGTDPNIGFLDLTDQENPKFRYVM